MAIRVMENMCWSDKAVVSTSKTSKIKQKTLKPGNFKNKPKTYFYFLYSLTLVFRWRKVLIYCNYNIFGLWRYLRSRRSNRAHLISTSGLSMGRQTERTLTLNIRLHVFVCTYGSSGLIANVALFAYDYTSVAYNVYKLVSKFINCSNLWEIYNYWKLKWLMRRDFWSLNSSSMTLT